MSHLAAIGTFLRRVLGIATRALRGLGVAVGFEGGIGGTCTGESTTDFFINNGDKFLARNLLNTGSVSGHIRHREGIPALGQGAHQNIEKILVFYLHTHRIKLFEDLSHLREMFGDISPLLGECPIQFSASGSTTFRRQSWHQ